MNARKTSLSFLSVERGKQQGQIYELHQEVVQIGRTPGNDFMLNEPTVSQFHARSVRLKDGTVSSLVKWYCSFTSSHNPGLCRLFQVPVPGEQVKTISQMGNLAHDSWCFLE